MKLTDAEIEEGLKLCEYDTPGSPRECTHDDINFMDDVIALLPKALKELQELREVCLNQTGEILNLQNERTGLYADLIGQEHRLGSRIEVLEAKLAKAVEALEFYVKDQYFWGGVKMTPEQKWDMDDCGFTASEALKELRGEK